MTREIPVNELSGRALKDGGRMKQYTDTERLDWRLRNDDLRIGDVDGKFCIYRLTPDISKILTGFFDTPRAAIDDAMNRETEVTANEQEEKQDEACLVADKRR